MRKLIMPAVLALGISTGAAAQAVQSDPNSRQETAPAREAQKLTFDGDLVLWTVAIKPDKTSDFERVMTRVREALKKSSKPERSAQAAGWKVLRLAKPLPDGSIGYVHVISPVVPGADYTVMQILYDEFPEERQTLYELYRGAFAKNVALATGNVVVDMSQALGAPAAPPPAAEPPTTTAPPPTTEPTPTTAPPTATAP